MLASNDPDFSISISAPGKVILHGEHSVVFGKLAIAGSLGLRTRINLKNLPPSKEIIQIESSAVNVLKCFEIQDLKNKLLNKLENTSNWKSPDSINQQALLKFIESYLNETCEAVTPQQKLSLLSVLYLYTAIIGSSKAHIKPIAIRLTTDLNVGSGCGSSASFAVCLAAVLIRYVLLEQSSQNSENPVLSQFNEEQLDLISKWAYSAEKIIHGSPSGIDNTICTYGSVVAFRKSSGHKFLKIGELKLLLINTNVKRNTKNMVAIAAARKANNPKLIDSILDTLEIVSESAIDYLEQINSETDNCKLMNIYNKLGEVIDINHHLLQCLGCSHATLDKICDIVKNKGFYGKLTGAGGGGYAIAVIPPNVSDETIKELTDKLSAEGFGVILTNLGGSGVTIDQ